MRKVNLQKVNDYFNAETTALESKKIVEKLVDDYLHSDTPKAQTEVLLDEMELLFPDEI